jgi:hypothetical protein
MLGVGKSDLNQNRGRSDHNLKTQKLLDQAEVLRLLVWRQGNFARVSQNEKGPLHVFVVALLDLTLDLPVFKWRLACSLKELDVRPALIGMLKHF